MTGLFVGLAHSGRMTHICVSKVTTIGSGNALSNAGILFFGHSEHTAVKFTHFHSRKCTRKYQLENGGYIDGLVQHCSNSIANALELLQFSTKPSILSWLQCAIIACRNCPHGLRFGVFASDRYPSIVSITFRVISLPQACGIVSSIEDNTPFLPKTSTSNRG